MNSTKSIENLTKLMRVAKQKTEEISTLIADLEAAKVSAGTSLDWLEQAIKTEERRPGVNLVDLARYMEGATQKRTALAATQDTLKSEIEIAKKDLSDSFAAMKKLEHLVSVARRADQKRRVRREATVSDGALRAQA